MIVESDPLFVTRHVRAARLKQQLVGLVPTMGALHSGHASLIEAARAECGYVVVSIFVNPTQFGPTEDFGKYPRTLDADLQLCRDAGADLIFTPTVSEMYGESSQTVVHLSRLTSVLEGASRPGHFDGVSTVVAKLFNIADPDKAYFGQKDFQQQLIIRRMVADLNFPLEIVNCPIIRESDGLAMSSRNRYLSESDRRSAVALHQALVLAETLAKTTTLSAASISDQMNQQLRLSGNVEVSYAIIADPATLEPFQERPAGDAVALIAARVGSTRLIDNQILQFR
jgi:pantoate--beta-alanine ligase